MTNVYVKVVIAAEGIYSAQRGIPKWGGLVRPSQGFAAGIFLELAELRVMEPDILEFYTGAAMGKRRRQFAQLGYVVTAKPWIS